MIYSSIDSVANTDDAIHYPVEILNTLNPPGFPYHWLLLRVGTLLILLRNFKPPKLCNGSRLQVKALHRNVVEATIISGSSQGKNVLIPRIPLISRDLPFQFKRLQFPLNVCFAKTINESQGQILKFAGIGLRRTISLIVSFMSSPRGLILLTPPLKMTKISYIKKYHKKNNIF